MVDARQAGLVLLVVGYHHACGVLLRKLANGGQRTMCGFAGSTKRRWCCC